MNEELSGEGLTTWQRFLCSRWVPARWRRFPAEPMLAWVYANRNWIREQMRADGATDEDFARFDARMRELGEGS